MKREEIEKILEKYNNVACECRIQLKTEFSLELFFEDIDIDLTENYFKGSYYRTESARECCLSHALFYAAFEDVEIVDEHYEERIKHKKKHITESVFLSIEKYGIELVLSKSYIEKNDKDINPEKSNFIVPEKKIEDETVDKKNNLSDPKSQKKISNKKVQVTNEENFRIKAELVELESKIRGESIDEKGRLSDLWIQKKITDEEYQRMNKEIEFEKEKKLNELMGNIGSIPNLV